MFLRYKSYVICYILCRTNPCIYKLDIYIYYTMYQSLSYYVILKTRKCAFQCFGSGIGSGFRSGIGFGFRFGIGFLWSHGHPMRRCSCFVFTSLQGCQRGVQRSRFTACMFQIPNSIRDRLKNMLNLLQLFYGCQNLRHGLGTAAKCCFRACGKTRLRPCSDHLSSITIYEVLRKK